MKFTKQAKKIIKKFRLICVFRGQNLHLVLNYFFFKPFSVSKI